MWQVLRRQQGEYYEREDPVKVPPALQSGSSYTRPVSKLDIAQRTIAMHETKPYAAPQDPLVLTAPYGNVVYDKIVRNLSHESVVLRRQAVQMLLDLYLLKGEHVVESLRANILDTLLSRLSVDPDDDMRTQCCIALEFIVKQPKGQEVVLSRGTQVLQRFVDAMEDQCSDVVVESLRLLASTHAAYNEHEATRRLVQLGVIPRYVKKALERDDSVCCAACGALSKVFDIKEAYIQCIQCEGVEAITKALRRNDEPMILVEASEVVSKVAIHGLGLARCTQLKTVASLLPHLRHENVAVRTSTTAAVAQLVVQADGKYLAVESGIVPALTAAIEIEDERDVLMNLVQTIRLVSENPEVRSLMRGITQRLRDIVSMAEAYPPLQLATQRALESIEWKPGMPLP